MKRDRTKRIYDLHAWIGVVSGLFMFVVSLSGVFALFGDEIRTWEDETVRLSVPYEPIPILPRLADYVEELEQEGDITFLTMTMPDGMRPFYQLYATIKPAAGGKSLTLERRWNAETGDVLPERGHGLSHWLVEFHRNLMLPERLGRALVGLAGMLLLMSILTGIVTHRKMLREMFTWRLDRSVRLRWQDSHKVLGVWGLPFHIMIAFTGAFLGLLVVLLPVTAMISFKGDQAAVIAAVQGPQVEASGQPAEMVPIMAAWDTASRAVGRTPEILLISHWGDRNSVYKFLYTPQGKLVRRAHVHVSGSTGELMGVRLTDRPGVASRVAAAVTPLHYATYGGILLKLLYALLGIGLCVLIATGLMMWLERRLHGNAGTAPIAFYRFLSRLTVGVTTGVCLASVAVFYGDKLIVSAPEDRLFWTGAIYFATWGAAVGYGFLRANEYRTCKEVLGTTAFGLMGIPYLNTFLTGDPIYRSIASGHDYVAGVDITSLILGLTLAAALLYVPDQRPGALRESDGFTTQRKRLTMAGEM